MYEGAGGEINHAELALGGGMIMLGSMKDDEHGRRFKAPGELGGAETSSSYIVVPDADAVYARAQAAGATIVRPLQEMDLRQPGVCGERSRGAHVERGDV